MQALHIEMKISSNWLKHSECSEAALLPLGPESSHEKWIPKLIYVRVADHQLDIKVNLLKKPFKQREAALQMQRDANA